MAGVDFGQRSTIICISNSFIFGALVLPSKPDIPSISSGDITGRDSRPSDLRGMGPDVSERKSGPVGRDSRLSDLRGGSAPL